METGGDGKKIPAGFVQGAAWPFLILTGLAGCALLLWWAVKFHPSNENMWMVPLCLIMVGTPIIICISFLADDVSETLEHLCKTPPPAPDP
ncbi:hypothetical protein IEQ34_014146 [Dendrobium chrysotoxum]|uniref:Uncharacterized protein n=1 Tax=Dendrobium chrysotoxum TaxID=161865 RepID=A0AAV7G322_DENCH|nr:hypothetical protein IEQ34_014146 [Dendrobium chrysotoxum]